jgi:hypothetical protein
MPATMATTRIPAAETSSPMAGRGRASSREGISNIVITDIRCTAGGLFRAQGHGQTIAPKGPSHRRKDAPLAPILVILAAGSNGHLALRPRKCFNGPPHT